MLRPVSDVSSAPFEVELFSGMAGACPAVGSGRLADGRLFYVRCRSGAVSVRIGREGDPADQKFYLGGFDIGDHLTGSLTNAELIEGAAGLLRFPAAFRLKVGVSEGHAELVKGALREGADATGWDHELGYWLVAARASLASTERVFKKLGQDSTRRTLLRSNRRDVGATNEGADVAESISAIRQKITEYQQIVALLGEAGAIDYTAAVRGALLGHWAVVRRWQRRGFDLNATICWGGNALHRAIASRSRTSLEALLAAGASPEALAVDASGCVQRHDHSHRHLSVYRGPISPLGLAALMLWPEGSNLLRAHGASVAQSWPQTDRAGEGVNHSVNDVVGTILRDPSEQIQEVKGAAGSD